jgi:hypothetical protein
LAQQGKQITEKERGTFELATKAHTTQIFLYFPFGDSWHISVYFFSA